MKSSFVRASALGLVLAARLFSAAEPAPAPSAAPAAAVQSPASRELEELVTRIRAKLESGQKTPEALAGELKEFDALYARHKSAGGEDAANILIMQAMLHLQVLGQNDQGLALLKILKQDLPNTQAGQNVDRIIEQVQQQIEAQKAVTSVIGQPAPELHFSWSSPASLTTLSALKGKVVVLDFWATWCGPCVATFPKIRELAEHYKGADVVIVGVTSLQGRINGLPGGAVDTKDNPAKEQELLAEFSKLKEMTWPIAISTEPVFNPAYGVNGIPHVAILGADGRVRHNGLHPAEPIEDKIAKIDALLKEAGLKVP